MAPFFFTYIVYAVISPYLPILFRGLGYSPSVIGVLLGVFEGAGIVGPFIFGYFADKIGRYKPGLIITNCLVLIVALPLALFRNPVISALFAIVIGLGFRSALPLLEAVTTIALGKNGDYGKIRTTGSVSFILMTLFFQSALVLPLTNPLNIAIWTSVSTALAMISMVFIPPAYERTRSRTAGTAKPAGNYAGSRAGTSGKRGIWSPLLVIGLIIMAMNRLGMAPVNSFFSLFLTESMQWNAVGFMWALASIAEVPFMFLSRRIINRFGAFNCLAFSVMALILRLLLYALFPTKTGVIIAQLLHSFCFGLFHPSAVTFISNCVPPERRALGMSLYLSLGSGLPTFLGNILGGFIVEHAGYRALYSVFAIFPLIGVGIYGITLLTLNSRDRMA